MSNLKKLTNDGRKDGIGRAFDNKIIVSLDVFITRFKKVFSPISVLNAKGVFQKQTEHRFSS